MLRIVNKTGVSRDTKVLRTDTGEDVSQTLALSYDSVVRFEQNGCVKAVLDPAIIAADITAGVTEWRTKHPVTGGYEQLAALEFADGTRVEFGEDGVPSVVPPAVAAEVPEVTEGPGAGLKIAIFHQPVKGPALYNVVGIDGKPINPKPLKLADAQALAENPPNVLVTADSAEA